jgi:hypothetical protein
MGSAVVGVCSLASGPAAAERLSDSEKIERLAGVRNLLVRRVRWATHLGKLRLSMRVNHIRDCAPSNRQQRRYPYRLSRNRRPENLCRRYRPDSLWDMMCSHQSDQAKADSTILESAVRIGGSANIEAVRLPTFCVQTLSERAKVLTALAAANSTLSGCRVPYTEVAQVCTLIGKIRLPHLQIDRTVFDPRTSYKRF